jgi:hypothetical protein
MHARTPTHKLSFFTPRGRDDSTHRGT